MKEDFLHYLWKFKLYETNTLKTVDSQELFILNSGTHNKESGPDFFNGLIKIDDQLWAGNIEIHLKSSDWYVHKHEEDVNYDSVVLHVVWEYDVPVYYANDKEIPTIELQNYVNSSVLSSYFDLFSQKQKWILCEDSIKGIDSFIIDSWLNRLYFERLERKTKFILELLKSSNNDWEAVLFQLLSKSFGMKLNGDSFYNLSKSFDYSILRKCQNNPGALEILLFGQAGFFEKELEDVAFCNMKKEYSYLQKKFKLTTLFYGEFQFFRLRPNNFPTIRISQLANLYELNKNLFSKIIELYDVNKFYELFDVKASTYWDTHYVFGKESKSRIKRTSNKFSDILLINVIIPLKYAYAKYHHKNHTNQLEYLIESIGAEKNSIVDAYILNGVKVSSALQSQGLIELKQNYCDQKKCLDCSIGIRLIKGRERKIKG